MNCATFGVAASCFAANMAVQKNAVQLAQEFPTASRAAQESFYVDDGLTGASSIDAAIDLRVQLQEMFAKGCFKLRKWNSSEAQVLESIPSDLREAEEILPITDSGNGLAKTLGILWNTRMDSFTLTVSAPRQIDNLTKRTMLSDISRVFDALGWFSPTTIQMKVIIQRTWELDIGWDDQVPEHILDKWKTWRSELPVLSNIHL